MRIHPAGTGLREGVGGRNVGLEIEDGCVVQKIGFGDREGTALNGEQADAGKADGIGPVGGARGEGAHARTVGRRKGRTCGGAPGVAVPVEQKENPQAFESVEIAQGRFKIASAVELDGAGAARENALPRRFVFVRGVALEKTDGMKCDRFRHDATFYHNPVRVIG